MQLAYELEWVRTQGGKLRNLYKRSPYVSEAWQKRLDEKMGKELSNPTSPYDSHPAPRERIELLEPLKTKNFTEADSPLVWDLLLNAEALQTKMTTIVQNLSA